MTAPAKIDLNLMVIFDTVMSELHVTRAAEQLDLTQSAVSNSLNRLRKHFGDPLFVKASRGVTPTPKAQELWPPIHEALKQLRNTILPADFDPDTARMDVRIAMADLSAAMFTPILYRLLQDRAHGISLSCIPQTPGQSETQLMRGEIDFLIGIPHRRNSMMRSRLLWADGYVFVARKDHRAFENWAETDLAALCDMDHLIVNTSGDPEASSPVDEALLRQGVTRSRKLVVNQFSVASEVLRASDLVAILPRRLAQNPFHANGLRSEPLKALEQGPQMFLSWHRRKEDDASHIWMRNLLVEAAGMLATK